MCKNVFWGIKESMKEQYVFLWDRNGYRKCCVGEIVWIKACRSYCEINFLNSDKVLVSMPLSEVYDYLSESGFVRIHRSYAVNLHCIERIVGNLLILENKTQLIIGREYRKKVLDLLPILGVKKRQPQAEEN